jgi:DnaK suppressor protein
MAPNTMNSIDLKAMQDLLLDRSKVLEVDLDGLESETMGDDADPAGSHSMAPEQMAELASDASEKAIMYGRMESESGELQEVREALERLENGTFGLCENCGEAIPLERLEAIPYASLCVKCKSAEELQ